MCVFFQDTFQRIYSPASSRENGTIYSIRNVFNFRNVKKNITKCFDQANELQHFATEGYIVAAALEYMNIREIPDSLPFDDDDLFTYFGEVCNHILILSFHPPSSCQQRMETVSGDDEADEESDMVCGRCNLPDIEANSGNWILCDNRKCNLCFHFECVDIDETNVPDDDAEWFCSKKCEREVKKKSRKSKSKKDNILEYTKAVLWSGVGSMVRHDAVRENDGERIIRHWKYDMINYFENHHPKYFILGFRLLTAVNGGVSARLKEDLIWNRTVNNKGGADTNIEMDLQMEHFNNEYKSMCHLFIIHAMNQNSQTCLLYS